MSLDLKTCSLLDVCARVMVADDEAPSLDLLCIRSKLRDQKQACIQQLAVLVDEYTDGRYTVREVKFDALRGLSPDISHHLYVVICPAQTPQGVVQKVTEYMQAYVISTDIEVGCSKVQAA